MNLLLSRPAISLVTSTLLHGVNQYHTYGPSVQNIVFILNIDKYSLHYNYSNYPTGRAV
jgi:hypothetical protein